MSRNCNIWVVEFRNPLLCASRLEDFSFQFSLCVLALRFIQFDLADYSRPAPFHQWSRHRTLRHDASVQPHNRPDFPAGTGNRATLGDGTMAFAGRSDTSLRRPFCARLLRSGCSCPAPPLPNARLGSESDAAGLIYSVSAARPYCQHTRYTHSHRYRHQLPVRNRQPLD